MFNNIINANKTDFKQVIHQIAGTPVWHATAFQRATRRPQLRPFTTEIPEGHYRDFQPYDSILLREPGSYLELIPWPD